MDYYQMAKDSIKNTYKFDLNSETIHMTREAVNEFAKAILNEAAKVVEENSFKKYFEVRDAHQRLTNEMFDPSEYGFNYDVMKENEDNARKIRNLVTRKIDSLEINRTMTALQTAGSKA